MTVSDHTIEFKANLGPLESALAGFGNSAQSLLGRVRALAETPVNIPVSVSLAGGAKGATARGIGSRFASVTERIANAPASSFTSGADGVVRATAAFRRELEAAAAEFRGFVSSEITRGTAANKGNLLGPKGGFLKGSKGATEVQATQNALNAQYNLQTERAIANRISLVAVERGYAEHLAENAVLQAHADGAILDAKGKEIVARHEATQRRLAGVNEPLAPRRTFTQGLGRSVERSGGLGGFFGSGLATTLRFAVPSAILFGALSGVKTLVKETELLQQTFVRLQNQFKSLGERGVFGGSNPAEQAALATAALDKYRKELFSIAADTGVTNDATFELGQQFIGLFSSLDSGGTSAQVLAEQATRMTAEFSVIANLGLTETFNDLVGSVRSFGDTGESVLKQLNDLTDAVVNVSDATGVSAGEITDFVGRIGPAAAQAGLALNQVIALGATALQGSGVGGGALAEQFGRILTGLTGKLGVDLSRLAQEFQTKLATVDVGGGQSAADLFNVDTIASGELDKVITGLIKGFDALTAAEQRQIISSIGSRREGATLAAVLQNASTFTTSMSAATEANGQRQQRFGDIIVQLTGQMNRLKVEFAQAGQVLFAGGLRGLLSGLITGIGDLAGVFQIFASSLKFVTDVLGKVLPAGTGAAIGQIVILSLALRPVIKLFSGAAIAANVAAGATGSYSIAAIDGVAASEVYSGAISRTTAALTANALAAQEAVLGVRSFSGAAALASSGVSKVTGALGKANIALVVAFTAFSLLRKSYADSKKRAEETAKRQEELASILATNGDKFDLAAAAAQRYADALENVNSKVSDSGQFSDTPAGFLANTIVSQLGQKDSKPGKPDAQAELNVLLSKSDVGGLEGLVTLLQQDTKGSEDALQAILDLRNANDGIFNRLANDIPHGLPSPDALAKAKLSEITRDNGTPQIIKDLIAQAKSGDNKDAIFNIADVINNVLTSEAASQAKAEADALKTISKAVTLNDKKLNGLDQAAINKQLDDLRTSGDKNPGITLLNKFGLGVSAKLKADTEIVLTNIDFVKEQFAAGLIGANEFTDTVGVEVISLQSIADSLVAAGSSNSLASAAEVRKQINDLQSELVDIAKADFDRTVEIAKLLGSPLEGQDLVSALSGLILNPDIVAGSSTFTDTANQIVEAEKNVAIKLAGEATTIEEVDKIINDFQLSVPASVFFTVDQVANNDVVNQVFSALQIGGASLDASYREVADALEAGADLNATLIAMIKDEIDRLTEQLNALGADESGARSALQARVDNLNALATVTLGKQIDLPTGADVTLNRDDLTQGKISQAEQLQKTLIDNFEARLKIYSATGQNQDLGSKVKDLVALIEDPSIVDGSQEALDYAIQLADAVRQGLELEGAEADAFSKAVLGLADTAGLSVAGIAEAGIIFQQLANVESNFNIFLAQFLGTGTDLLNGLLQTMSVLIQGGASAQDALTQSIAESIAELKRQRDNAIRFDRGHGVAAINAAIKKLEDIPQIIPDISVPNITPVHVTPAASSKSGGAANDAAKAAIDLQRAKFELLRAQIGDDPVKQAILAGQVAQFDIDTATNEADRIRGLASQVEANRSYWSAVHDVMQAQNDLAIAIADSLGDFAKVEELTVAGAQSQLDFLIASNAGAAAIANAQAALIKAQDAQANALTNAKLGDLGFLFSIGELSQSAYVAALEEIVAQLDPVADQDLWRQITKQIHDLKGSATELQFNLPDTFDLPTLFEVRRLNQSNVAGGAPSQGTTGFSAFSNNDNRQVQITVNVATGMDWQDARQVIGDAIGADQSVFSLNTKKY